MGSPDPPKRLGKRFEIARSLDDLLGILGELRKTAICPVCQENDGWIFPKGFERVVLTTTTGTTLEAIPYLCNVCGYIRLHSINSEPPPGTQE